MEYVSALYKPEWKEGAVRRQNKRPLSVEDIRSQAIEETGPAKRSDTSPATSAAPAPPAKKFKQPIKLIPIPAPAPTNPAPPALARLPSPQFPPVPVRPPTAPIPPAAVRPRSDPPTAASTTVAPLAPLAPLAPGRPHSEQVINLASDEGSDSDTDPLGIRDWPDTSPEERRAAERFRARQAESQRRHSQELERRRQARLNKASKEGKRKN